MEMGPHTKSTRDDSNDSVRDPEGLVEFLRSRDHGFEHFPRPALYVRQYPDTQSECDGHLLLGVSDAELLDLRKVRRRANVESPRTNLCELMNTENAPDIFPVLCDRKRSEEPEGTRLGDLQHRPLCGSTLSIPRT